MRQFEQWSDDGGHTETVAILEDVIATLEGVQTQHQVLLDQIYAACRRTDEQYRAASVAPGILLMDLVGEIQGLIEEDA